MGITRFSSIYNSPKRGCPACLSGEVCFSELKSFLWWSVTQQFSDDLGRL